MGKGQWCEKHSHYKTPLWQHNITVLSMLEQGKPGPTLARTINVMVAEGYFAFPDSKVHGANMGSIWGRQGQGGPHFGPMNFAICVVSFVMTVACSHTKLILISFVVWCGKYIFFNVVAACYMGLLPETQNCGCACVGNAGNVFPVTAGKRSRHASRHVRHARGVMHSGIAN